MSGTWVWSIDLEGMVNQFVTIETVEGIMREGKITKVKFRHVEINGEKFPIPDGVELNGEHFDVVEFSCIRRVTLR